MVVGANVRAAGVAKEHEDGFAFEVFFCEGCAACGLQFK